MKNASGSSEAWAILLALPEVKTSLLEKGFATLSATTMKQMTGAEPRLLAKHDTASERPGPLRDMQAVVFPIRNGLYLIWRDIHHRAYLQLPSRKGFPPRPFTSKCDLNAFDTYPKRGILSEAQALDFAWMSGIIADFTEADDLSLTLRGRSFSGSFEFQLPETHDAVKVEGVQIEIDAGYEGRDHLVLVEAKCGHRENSHVRQLWYPWLNWRKRTSKKIIPIFFIYSNGIYTLTQWKFSEILGEAECVKQKAYALEASPTPRLSLSDWQKNLTAAQEELLKGVFHAPTLAPLPQANDMDKILDIAACLDGVSRKAAELAFRFDMDFRQGEYYAQALVWLGLCVKTPMGYTLNPVGQYVLSGLGRGGRTEKLFHVFMAHPIMSQAISLLAQENFRVEKWPKERLSQVLWPGHEFSQTTLIRRADTLRHWLEWICQEGKLVA